MRKHFLAAATLFAIAPFAQAEPSSVSLDGFGTAGVVYADEEHADFVGNILAPDGAGRSRAWSPEVDSRLGLQFTGDLTEDLRGVIQVVAEQGHDEHYTPTVEWANLQYEVAHDLRVRAGRVVLPVFMVSEYRKVGYANHWVRPPQEVYQLVPVTNADGIDATYEWHPGEFTHNLRMTYGRKTARTPGWGKIEAEGSFTIANELHRGATTLFAGYSRTRLGWDEFQPLFDAYRAQGAEGEAIADRYEVDEALSELISVGLRYDPGPWFTMAEWTRSENESFLADSRAWYATTGFRVGEWTPYLTLAEIEATSATSHAGVGDPALDGMLNALLGSAAQQERIALGARWDFTPGAAAKIQIDYLDLDEGSSGTLGNPDRDNFERGGIVRVFSLALDFVF